jgi:23S rRNA pseudouridine1911/1915/1917 synthase
MSLKILYEDDFLLILNKPAGLAIHPSITHYEDSLSNGVKFYFEKNKLQIKIRPVNRLDKDTSGIIIFAKHAYIQECLIRQMKENTFSKKYLALVEGFFKPEEGTIKAPITRKENSIIERKIDLNSNLESEQAITHYKTLEKLNNASLVEFSLETGRTHQIRVHSKFKNHPLIGDSLYGNKSDLISRQALHSYKISFVHPISKSIINIEAPIPEDFDKAYKLLSI